MQWRIGWILLGSLIGLLALPVQPRAAAVERWGEFASPVFRNLTIDSGLPRQNSRQVIEDVDGFLWVGAYGGLARWDGYRFHVFQPDPKNPEALPDHFIQVMHRDEKGRLWLGTRESGLVMHDRVTDRFVTYRANRDGLSSDAIYGLEDDGEGGIWIASTGGLDRMDAAGRVTSVPSFAQHPQGLPDKRLLAVLRDSKGTLWIGAETGLYRRMSADAPFIKVPLDVANAVPVTFYEDRSGRIWVGTRQSGAFIVEPGADHGQRAQEIGAANPVLPGQYICAILEVQPGVIWVATFTRGIVAFFEDGSPARHIQNEPMVPSSLPDNIVNGLYRDGSGLIWVATARGIGYHNPAQDSVMTLFSGAAGRNRISEANITSVEVMANGEVWLGLRSGGIDILDPAGGTVRTIAPDPAHPEFALPRARVQSIAAAPRGEVFVGTEAGLYRVDPIGQAVERVTVSGVAPDARIDAVLIDRDVLWFGGFINGLWSIPLDGADPAVPLRHIDGSRLTEPRVTVLKRGADGAIWIGTWRGINRYDPPTDTLELMLPDPADPASVNRGFISSLLIDRRGRLWVGTLAGGLGLLEARDAGGRPRFRQLGTRDGMANNSPNMLLEDRAGRIWASADHGVSVVDPDSFAIEVLREAHGVTVRNFWVHSGARTAAGDILFGGTGGLVVVRPDRIKRSGYEPPIVVTDVRVGGKSMPAGRFNDRRDAPALIVPPEASGFTVDFASLDFANPLRIHYRYRLEGFDTDWIATDAVHRQASYTNLWPGQYRLVLAGTNRDGVWSPNGLALDVRVLPAWYQTLWFYLALAAAGLSLVWALVVARTVRLQRRRHELEALVLTRTAELVQINQELDAARQMAMDTDRRKSEFLAHMSHELRTPLNAIIGFAQMMERAMLGPVGQPRYREYARDILFSGEHLLSVINNILDMSKVEAGKWELENAPVDLSALLNAVMRLASARAARDGVMLVLVGTVPPVVVRGDERTLRQILLNLLINAVKFAGEDRRVELSTALLDDGGLEITVTDHGPGMTPEDLARTLTPFEAGSGQQSRQLSDSTGLGLPLSRAFAELHGGSLVLDSEPGRGTAARLRLPADRVVSLDRALGRT